MSEAVASEGHGSDIVDMFRLDGLTAIVTGGTRGLGFAIADAFRRAGANVAICGRRQDQATDAARSIGGDTLGLAAHLGDPVALQELVDATFARFGTVDVVVNNAGISLGIDIGEIAVSGIQKSLEVNLIGPLMLIQSALPYLRASSGASVINVLTAGLARPSTGLSVYLAAKAGLEMLTRTMAKELAPSGIRVNAISPGPFRTDMVTNMDIALQERAVAGTPLGRMADPSEIGGAALFLASRASNFVTGTTLVVDGGMTI